MLLYNICIRLTGGPLAKYSKSNYKEVTISECLNKALLQTLSDVLFVTKRDATGADFKAKSDEDFAGKNIRETGFSQIYLDTVFITVEKL
ncbi:MAG TPA: hypothetical protein DCP92_22120 [Nitrospiraceae bacterium]|nr:hypothetical protein [Nitrospiraceae bacterium]